MKRSIFRRVIRTVVPLALRTVVWQALGHWRNAQHYVEPFGVLAGTMVYRQLYLRSTDEVSLRIPPCRTPILLRPKTTDLLTFEQVFMRHEYGIKLPFSPRHIVDAGANIGLATIYFANRFPDARIIALEPEPVNFDLLLRNTQAYSNVQAIRAGLWSRRATLSIENPADDPWAFRVCEAETPEGGLPAVTVEDLMARLGTEQLDLLKMDIEGSEREVLRASAPWIDRVNAIVVELHDRLQPGCRDALEAAVASKPFVRHASGEHEVLLRQA
jgi:FkbM family methyltransferase